MSAKLTTEEFIEKAIEIHEDKYDYSKVDYKYAHIKVKIICKEHGVFEQTPNNHLNGNGCPKCSGNIKLTTEKFIKKAREIHNDKYDYTQVDYINIDIKVKIICKEHGVFEQTPSNHLNGQGCPKCIGRNKTTDEFISEAKLIHGDKYDYSQVDYMGVLTKVKIICKKHGVFEQTPSNHLNGQGCPKCSGNIKLTTEKFIKKAREIHNDKYDYTQVDYINIDIKVKIICKEHGIFEQSPYSHLKGSGCPKCAIIINGVNKRSKVEDFIKKAREIHSDKYDYSNVKYINFETKVKIICNKHGVFEQTPDTHLKGSGCPKCNSSRGEIKVSNYLSDNNIIHITQHKFNDCKNERPLPFDFYLPEHNICIEYDGIQHFLPIDRFGGNKALERTKKHDSIKSKYCKENNIQLIRIHYEDYDNIENILNKYVK